MVFICSTRVPNDCLCEEASVASDRDVGSASAQELRKWCLLTELCFLCDK